ncbi:Crp/Fnr family transcriptional regulator [Pedobacter frigidisoli]|uniref:Crp/Fnr family transcriptional regulator n=1 Tax=Pedobacter frigidisoli TaxID=2530455 RepID=A0A4R0P5A7_9SPHI|nr:Crp/Fnr family transcriptional regulator [Pedobacter frigidisoli]TCD10499.1 Crp/Fnr family transcriptional regulator [Pedobacter frigidisoli]
MAEINDDNKALIRFLNNLMPLSDEIIELAIQQTFNINVRKNSIITCPKEQTDDCLFLILKGIIRGFIIDEGKDITAWIVAENTLFGNIRNPGVLKPTYNEQYQALEDTDLIVLPYSFIDKLYDFFPETNILARKLLAINYHISQERSILSRIPSAESRYKQFQEGHPSIKFRVPLKYLASYLGMRVETLSRLRKKAKDDKN